VWRTWRRPAAVSGSRLPRCVTVRVTNSYGLVDSKPVPPHPTDLHIPKYTPTVIAMAPKKSGGEGSKKAQGQARKADAAAAKQADKDRAAAAEEAKKWDVGGKSNSKA
jgi:hypothetical protein